MDELLAVALSGLVLVAVVVGVVFWLRRKELEELDLMLMPGATCDRCKATFKPGSIIGLRHEANGYQALCTPCYSTTLRGAAPIESGEFDNWRDADA